MRAVQQTGSVEALRLPTKEPIRSSKMASQKKTAANQRNRILSKGPKDTSKTRHNAIRHGILSEQTLIRTGDGKEDPEEHQSFGDAIREDLVPIGAIEQLLVEDIICYWWRKRRILVYESALISGQWDAKGSRTTENSHY